MFLGNQRSFGVQYSRDDELDVSADGSHWMFGHFKLWSGGRAVGDADFGCSLQAMAASVRWLRGHEGKRVDPELFALSAPDLIDRVYNALYVDTGQSDDQVRLDALRFSPFIGLPEDQIFEGWQAVIVEGGEHARYVWRRRSESVSFESRLAVGEFDDVLKQFVTALALDATAAEQDTRARK